MGCRALGSGKALEQVDPRDAQAGSPIALTLFDLLADPASTLRGLLRVSDIFCVRLTCKEAWRCVQHRPLTKHGVLWAAADSQDYDHHVPLLRWCLRNGIVGASGRFWRVRAIGETGDAELVSELLKVEPKIDKVVDALLCGVSRAGHDGLALQLLADLVEPDDDVLKTPFVKSGVAEGGCIRTAAAIDDDPTSWLGCLPIALHNGRQLFVEWVLADVEPDGDGQFIVDAAVSGSLELVKWLHSKGHAVGESTLTNAAASGNVDLCKWVASRGLVPTVRAMEAAATRGHLQVLEWLLTRGCMCTSEVLRRAVHMARVPVVAWCLDHHPHPSDAGDLLALSCRNGTGTAVFEYLADQCGLQSSPTELMHAAAECHTERFDAPFDAAILVKRYGTPLYPRYMIEALYREDLGRLRFALSQGQGVSAECYEVLIRAVDATLLNEVLLARKRGGSLPEYDRRLIAETLCDVDCHPHAKKVLADHSIVV